MKRRLIAVGCSLAVALGAFAAPATAVVDLLSTVKTTKSSPTEPSARNS